MEFMRFWPFLGILVLFVALAMQVNRPHENLDSRKWPVVDKHGYVQAYKESGSSRWMNWWTRDRHALLSFFMFVVPLADLSTIPTEAELKKTLPLMTPYWLAENATGLAEADGIRATWLGHATVLIEVDGAVLLADPMFSSCASPFPYIGFGLAGIVRYRQPACEINELPDNLHGVVVSHNHYDHLDIRSVQSLHRRYGDRIHWYIPMNMKRWFEYYDIKHENIHELSWWDERKIPGTDVKYLLSLYFEEIENKHRAFVELR